MSDNMLKITLFLAVVTVLIAVNVVFGKLGAEIADRKGYPRPFGFLFGFYFSLPGFLFLRGMKTNDVELRRRETEKATREAQKQEAELAGVAQETIAKPKEKEPALPWDNLVYPARRPNFVGAIVLMGVVFGITWMLQLRPEDLGGRQASVNSIPYVSGKWLCVYEETLTSDRQVVRREFGKVGSGWGVVQESVAPDKGDESLINQLKADSYFIRYYQNMETGQRTQCYIVYRRYGRREFNHNPDMCFPAGGYVMKNRVIDELPYAGRMVETVHMTFDGSKVQRLDGQVGMPETTVSYIFASGKKTEHVFLKQQMWMALERLVPNKNGWALIRLTTDHVKYRGAGLEAQSGDEAFAAQQDFMEALGPEIEKAITTDETATETPAPPPAVEIPPATKELFQ